METGKTLAIFLLIVVTLAVPTFLYAPGLQTGPENIKKNISSQDPVSAVTAAQPAGIPEPTPMQTPIPLTLLKWEVRRCTIVSGTGVLDFYIENTGNTIQEIKLQFEVEKSGSVLRSVSQLQPGEKRTIDIPIFSINKKITLSVYNSDGTLLDTQPMSIPCIYRGGSSGSEKMLWAMPTSPIPELPTIVLTGIGMLSIVVLALRRKN